MTNPRCVLKTAHPGPCLYAETETLPWWYCGKAQERVDMSTDTERRIALQDAKRLISTLSTIGPNIMLDRVWGRLYDELYAAETLTGISLSESIPRPAARE